MAEHHRVNRRRDYSRLNHDIHIGLVALAGNAALESTHAALLVRAGRGRHNALESEARWVEAMAEHELIITERNGRRAGELMLHHDLHTRDVLRAQLETDKTR